MKFLLTSDSHGQTTELSTLYNRHKDEVDMFLHAGDSELAPDHEAIKGFKGVSGNCDFVHDGFPNEQVETVGPHRLLLTHGHLYRVKMTSMPLYYKSEEAGADIVCFGHTHIAGAFQEQGKVFINPGSLRLPRQPDYPTYVIAEVSDDRRISVQFFDDSGEPVEQLSKVFHI